jgi:hypothetical protein
VNKTETIKIMAILKAAYPYFYSKMPQEELNGVVEVWKDAFSDIPVELVAVAVKSLIKTHSGYPPDIASIHLELKNVVSAATDEPTDEELWYTYKRAVQSSGYCENETFDKLPPILQRYCGSARTLYEHAMMPLEIFNSVLHGQFLKQLPIMRQRQEYRESLPEPMKNMIAGMSKRMELPAAEQAKTPQELNEKRNKIVEQLVAPILKAEPIPKSEYIPLSAEEKERRKRDILSKLAVSG